MESKFAKSQGKGVGIKIFSLLNGESNREDNKEKKLKIAVWKREKKGRAGGFTER